MTHGALVVMLAVLLVVTLQGLVSMLGVMTVIRDQRLSSLDTEEQLHRAAWDIEVELRRGRLACPSDDVRGRIERAANRFEIANAESPDVAPVLRQAAARYLDFAREITAGSTCELLASAPTDERRLRLDEDLTDAWIDRLQEVHTDIEAKEARARDIGDRTKKVGIVIAVLGAALALVIARVTAASVTRPIAALARAATRLGEGEFAPIVPVGGPMEVEALRSDLERTREKLLSLDRMKQSFLASVSHELRSPLGRLREALSLLSDGTVGELSDRQKRVVTLASRACEQEVRIVEALLDMTRIGSGMPVQRAAGVEVGRVVEAAVDAEKGDAATRNVNIAVEIPESLPSMTADEALLERAIANLIRNAVSVSPKDATVGVTVTHAEETIRVEVRDCGPGLAPELAQRIFEPFNAAAVKSAGRPAGIGLGLSLVREVARAHGGDVSVRREDDATIFRFDISTLEQNP
jgi:two-component system sensor histidine kinase GlrK